jgi:predicted nucleotidyltransferase
MTKTELTERIAGYLANDRRITAAFLLGSAVRDALRPDSDVDIALLPEAGTTLTGFDRANIAADLAALVHRDVDLGVLDTTNLVYAKEAYLNGECIFCRDSLRRDLFGATVLGEYLDLREVRQEVEHAYQA